MQLKSFADQEIEAGTPTPAVAAVGTSTVSEKTLRRPAAFSPWSHAGVTRHSEGQSAPKWQSPEQDLRQALGNLHTASRAIRSRTTRTRAQASLSGRELRYWVLCFVTGRSGTSVFLYQEASRRQTASCCGSGTSVSEKTSRRPCSRRLRLRQYSMGLAGDVLVFDEPMCALQACIEILQAAAIESCARDGHFRSISQVASTSSLYEDSQHRASSGPLRLLRWSRCDRAGWKADVKIWVATLAICPSRCRVPSRSRAGAVLHLFDHLSFEFVEGAYKNDVKLLPKELDAKVRKLHFPPLGAELSAIEGTGRLSRSMPNSSSWSRAPAGVVPHSRSSMGHSSSTSRAPAGVVPHSSNSLERTRS